MTPPVHPHVKAVARALCSGDPDKVPFGETQSTWPAWMDQIDNAKRVLEIARPLILTEAMMAVQRLVPDTAEIVARSYR
jgi:hypothetical protein